ncbi:MAG: HIT domain-containing protein [Candidatus Buchananbacteria bacterium]|jgi:histidine triad (HIT) family protein
MKCLFCSIIKGQKKSSKVWENRDFILLLVPKPINPGHVILIPKKHANYIFSIPEPLYSKTFQTAKKISLVLKKLTSAKRIGLAVEGFGVSHVHIHLVPVNKGNELNPLRAKEVSVKKLQQMQSEFIKHFKKLK